MLYYDESYSGSLICTQQIELACSQYQPFFPSPSWLLSLLPPVYSPSLPPSLLPSQFESYSLNTALYLLDRFGLESELRRSPVHVSRTLATMVGGGVGGEVGQGVGWGEVGQGRGGAGGSVGQ